MALAPRGKRGKAVASGDVELAKLPTNDDVEVTEPKTPTDERRDSELEEILTELGSDTTVKIWRRGVEGAGKNAMCGSMSGDGFTLELLLDTYGGGDYSLHIFQGRTLKDKILVSLDPSVPARNPRVKATTAAAGTSLSDMTGILGAMATMSMQGMQMMQTMMAGQAQGSQAMINAMASMMANNNTKDPTDTALRMVELLSKRDGGTTQLADVMSMFEKGLNLGAKMNPAGDDGVMNVVGEGVKTLGVLIDGIVTKQKAEAAALGAGRGPGVFSGPHPVAVDAAVSAMETAGGPDDNAAGVGAQAIRGNVPMNGERAWTQAARPHMKMLLSVARFMSPQAAAETVSKNLSDDEFYDLMDDVHDQTAPGFGGRLAQYFPEVGSVDPEWFGAVLDLLIQEYANAQADDDATGSAATGAATGERDASDDGEGSSGDNGAA